MSDWTPVVGVVFGIPAIGFAGRMVIRAIADGIVRIRAAGRAPVDASLGERMGRIEAELASLRDGIGHLSAVESFYTQLQTPAGRGAAGGSSGARAPVIPPGQGA